MNVQKKLLCVKLVIYKNLDKLIVEENFLPEQISNVFETSVF